MNMSELDYLGGVLQRFYEEDKENPQLINIIITVEENGKVLEKGTAEEIKDKLKEKYSRKILKWDAYFHIVHLSI